MVSCPESHGMRGWSPLFQHRYNELVRKDARLSSNNIKLILSSEQRLYLKYQRNRTTDVTFQLPPVGRHANFLLPVGAPDARYSNANIIINEHDDRECALKGTSRRVTDKRKPNSQKPPGAQKRGVALLLVPSLCICTTPPTTCCLSHYVSVICCNDGRVADTSLGLDARSTADFSRRKGG